MVEKVVERPCLLIMTVVSVREIFLCFSFSSYLEIVWYLSSFWYLSCAGCPWFVYPNLRCL